MTVAICHPRFLRFLGNLEVGVDSLAVASARCSSPPGLQTSSLQYFTQHGFALGFFLGRGHTFGSFGVWAEFAAPSKLSFWSVSMELGLINKPFFHPPLSLPTLAAGPLWNQESLRPSLYLRLLLQARLKIRKPTILSSF